MLRIDCPWCGPRDETEFRCGGELAPVRPEPFDRVDAATWRDHLFVRANTCGPHAERWLHVYGCRRWFSVFRDTRTHVIAATGPLDLPPASVVSS
ncbi:sarcosine oxidase subunit delta [Phenylobacterium sp.]|jgi:sarcosine oxidase subunit delta|uniref:sarcosine oxidase subunit delta n=1 Tax=Phenylobacterium sp. TaxID=1871053 RepID=UPI0037C9ACA6